MHAHYQLVGDPEHCLLRPTHWLSGAIDCKIVLIKFLIVRSPTWIRSSLWPFSITNNREKIGLFLVLKMRPFIYPFSNWSNWSNYSNPNAIYPFICRNFRNAWKHANFSYCSNKRYSTGKYWLLQENLKHKPEFPDVKRAFGFAYSLISHVIRMLWYIDCTAQNHHHVKSNLYFIKLPLGNYFKSQFVSLLRLFLPLKSFLFCSATSK